MQSVIICFQIIFFILMGISPFFFSLSFHLVLRAQFSCPLGTIFASHDRSFIATFVALIRFGDKSLYKLQNVPRIFDLRSKFSFLDHPFLSSHPHLLIVLSRSTISSSGGHKNCIKSTRSAIGESSERRREDRSELPSFRRVEIETPWCFTVCTLRGNWKFYERPRRCGRKRDPRSYIFAADPSHVTFNFFLSLSPFLQSWIFESKQNRKNDCIH